MTLMSMTFHEYYGELPKGLLTLYRKYNASPVDHDRLVAAATDRNGVLDWTLVLELVHLHSDKGYLALPFYL